MIKDWALAQSNGDPNTAKLLTNAVENAFASIGGAAAGAAIGGGSGAFNGIGISSSIQEYNMAGVDDALEAAALAGVAIWAVANNQDVGQALSDVISHAGDMTNNVYGYFLDDYINTQAQGMGRALMGMAMMAQAAPEFYNQLAQYASQSVEQYGQYIDLMQQLGATIYGAYKNNEGAKGQEQSSGTAAAGGAPSPDNNNDDDQDDEKPTKYEANDAHLPSTGKYNPNKTIEPSDAENIFVNSLKNNTLIKGKSGTWYAVGKEGVYRFAAKNTKAAHFNGIMSREEIFGFNKPIGRAIVNALEKQMGKAAARKWK